MDGKKVPSGDVTSRRGTSVGQKDKRVNGVDNTQFCNRIGCNGRLNYTKGAGVGCSEKAKHPSPSLRSSNGKEIIGNSSDTSRGKSLHRSQTKLSSHVKTSKSEVPTVTPSSSRPKKETEPGKVASKDVGSSSVSSNNRYRKMFPPKSDVSSISSGPGSSSFGNGSRYGLRNLKCNSISDVVPRGCSPSEPSFRKRVSINNKSSQGESSREKKITRHSSDDKHIPRSNRGISISESRSNRSWPSGTESGALVRTRRSMNVNSSSLQLPQPETPINSDMHVSSYQDSPEASSSGSSTYSLSASDGNDIPGSTLFTSTELGITRFMNSEASRRYNMDGIAEVLMELERIERNEEITYEQLLALETNLLLSSLNIYDQHRDLRLDIDNMSYEELLALEERMGSVSTALSEEAISKCLTRSIYQPLYSDTGITEFEDRNDIKCSICQEEYEVGDEIAKSECEHRFHLECIEQWLRVKNWCPICKTSATASQSTS